MQALLRDIKFSFILMRKRPAMSLLVIAALVLGIGLNGAIFSVVNAVLLRPLPLFQPDRIVRIYAAVKPAGSSLGISYPEYSDWKAQAHSFDAISVMRAFSFTLTGSGLPQHVKGISISASGFKVFGVTMALGRAFTEDEDRASAAPVVILNHSFWQRHFAGDPQILGQSLTLDGQTYTVIGVLQPTKVGTLEYPDVWLPNAPFVDQAMMNRENRFYFPAARLKASVSLSEAQAEMDALASRLAAAYPASNKDLGARVVGLTGILTQDARRPLTFLLLASSLICLMACANIGTVSVATTIERRRELTVRLALGATRRVLLRQLLLQALIYAGIAAILAIALAKLALLLFLHYFPNAVMRLQEATIDFRVIEFMIAVALTMALVIAIAPAFYASNLNLNTALKEESITATRSRSLGQSALITLQVSLATALLLVAGLLIKSFYQATKADLGFNPHQVLSFQVELPVSRYKTPEQQTLFHELALEKLSSIPGVTRASGISNLPLTYQADVTSAQADSDSSAAAKASPLVEDESVLPSFFQTMNIPLLKGRDFTDADRTNSPAVAIVDEVLAARFWPAQNPLGKHLRLAETNNPNPPWREVVGVVQQIKHFGPESHTIWPQVYVPEFQVSTPAISFLINTSAAAQPLDTEVEKTIHTIDSGIPIDNFQPMDTLLQSYLSTRKIGLFLLSGFASSGILLAAIGIYGLVSNAVTARRKEAAIRIALGATPGRIALLIARPALIGSTAGIILGCGLVVSLTRMLTSFLFGVLPLDPILYVASAIFIGGLTAAAVAIPVMRAFQINRQGLLSQ